MLVRELLRSRKGGHWGGLTSWAAPSPSQRLLVVLMPLLAGCSINHYQPSHFQFVTVVQKTDPGAGGWRAACLYVPIVNTSYWDTFICKFGVGMPIETEVTGPLSEALAQRIVANCANEAARLMLEFPNSPAPGAVCEEFKNAFDEVLVRAVPGSQVTKLCDKKTTPQSIDF